MSDMVACGPLDPAPDGPHGWIQWKGTDVCIDLHCECGAHGHIDADFLYQVKCRACGRQYDVSGFVRLLPNPKQWGNTVYEFGDEDD